MTAGPVALVGCGLWGSNVLRDLVDLGAEVVVVDPDLAVRRRAEVAGAVATCADLDDLGPVAGAVVATPASRHVEDVLALVQRAVPTFCEKPLATSRRDAHRIRDAGVGTVQVMHVWRHHPAIELMGHLAGEGVVGEVTGLRTTRAGWTSPRVDVDAVWTMLPHDLSLGLELLGRVPEPRGAVADVVGGRAAGLWGMCRDDGAGGSWLVADTSTRVGERRREVRLHGSDGVVVFDDREAVVRVERGRGRRPEVEEWTPDPEPALRRELRRWLAHLDGAAPPKSSVDEAVLVVEGVLALRELAGLVDG
ncbi:Gfo/Idh/MocA family oxidoreductase [Iamia majanohamensis]|uniref:Gfo/Idh/MocA family oxidoreductase n=1 Tax=Iamia majanohamensis TaxID=467976 RepID=A0AAE9YCH4_9ACTN|nr:Gfo/Idh/MocA family oxidoreductase [Iamia majanohamensis]WCO68668.1 Gfo/Idh/MocA family oxidoreductase [Iamia majanohamensis]